MIREAKAQEFTTLSQGARSVAEYAAKFIELSRFALYMILDEGRKSRKFESIRIAY